MMSKELDWEWIPSVLTSCDFVLLGLSPFLTVSLGNRLRTSSPCPHSSDMGSSEVSIISCLSLHSKITRVPPLGSHIQKFPDHPTLVVSVRRICHRLCPSSQSTACPMMMPGGHCVPMWELLLTSPASPQQQLRPVVSRGKSPPFPLLCSFLTNQSHASHQTVACDPLDVLRVLLTFALWEWTQGYG